MGPLTPGHTLCISSSQAWNLDAGIQVRRYWDEDRIHQSDGTELSGRMHVTNSGSGARKTALQ